MLWLGCLGSRVFKCSEGVLLSSTILESYKKNIWEVFNPHHVKLSGLEVRPFKVSGGSPVHLRSKHRATGSRTWKEDLLGQQNKKNKRLGSLLLPLSGLLARLASGGLPRKGWGYMYNCVRVCVCVCIYIYIYIYICICI